MLEMKIVLRAVLSRLRGRGPAQGAEVARRRNITISPADGARISTGVRERAAVPA